MASEVSICNRALRKIKAQTILNLTASTTEAIECNRLYAELRDELLEAHTWKFATTRAVLAPSASTPLYGWSYSLPVPADFIRLVSVEYDEDHQLEDGAIMANSDALYIKYIYRVTDPNRFSPLFRSALVARLAAELAVPIANDDKARETYIKEYDNLLSSARNSSASQGTPPVLEADLWTRSRL